MAKVDVVMPKMGESITEGTVIVWHKQPGDTIEVDEIILEIGTDKVDTEVPSPSAGVLTEILVPEGDTVDVGTLIATIETDVDAAVVAEPSSAPPADEPTAAEKTDPAPAPQAAPAADPPPPPQPSANVSLVEVVMPKMGESIMEGTILTWHKQVGDEIEMDETLLEIATDKVDTEVPSPAEGVLNSIEVPEGETVEVGTVIARIATGEGASVVPTPSPASSDAASSKPVPASPSPSGDGAATETVMATSGETIPRHSSAGKFFSPLVRSIAEEEGVSVGELERIGGSGREGRVTKADLMAYIRNRTAAPAPKPATAPTRPAVSPTRPASPPSEDYSGDDRVEIIKMDRMRQIIAHHMSESKKTSAHVTSFAEADVTNLVKLREKNKAMFMEREGIKLTYTPFFVHAAVDALREHPILNASVDGTNIIVKKDYHVGIAVAIGKRGLVVPVIKFAGHKNIAGLAHAASDLANRARNKQLQPDDLQGGTITVTNVGSLGSIMGTPIIAQPQVAIMATGAIKKRPVVIEDPELGDVIGIRSMMYISLSYDHRIIDGAMAASFLNHFVTVIESYHPDMEV
ncbi:MAG: 2-oxoglutarate dehydrogenase, E2 component, dihydrolipoamide succinyltransferase [Rhodothermales bacterium]|nr:2-oxoglutarate dehydrogenase, E2 component, dihydrolipoamide succinyltransferase [Rhodothermales bacterium]